MAKTQSFYNFSASVTTVQMVPYNAKRTGILIKNYAGNPFFISNDQADVTTKGMPLAVGEFLGLVRKDGDVPELAIYVATLVGVADVRIFETFGEAE